MKLIYLSFKLQHHHLRHLEGVQLTALHLLSLVFSPSKSVTCSCAQHRLKDVPQFSRMLYSVSYDIAPSFSYTSGQEDLSNYFSTVTTSVPQTAWDKCGFKAKNFGAVESTMFGAVMGPSGNLQHLLQKCHVSLRLVLLPSIVRSCLHTLTCPLSMLL